MTFIPTDIANYKAVTFLVPVTVYDGIVSPLNIALTPPPSLFYDGKAKAFRVSEVLSSPQEVMAMSWSSNPMVRSRPPATIPQAKLMCLLASRVSSRWRLDRILRWH